MNGHVGQMPPNFSGPPVPIANGSNIKQWSRLDPSEIIIHNLKCQDQLDDFIEDQMRQKLCNELIAKSKSHIETTDNSDETNRQNTPLHEEIRKFVEAQTIPSLNNSVDKSNTEWWQDLCDKTYEDSQSDAFSNSSDMPILGKRLHPDMNGAQPNKVRKISKCIGKVFGVQGLFEKERSVYEQKYQQFRDDVEN